MIARKIICLVLISCLSGFTQLGISQSCSGVQAGNETEGNPPVKLYVAQNQAFHVNLSAIASQLTASELADIKQGISSWAGTNGISIVFDSSAPGAGVVTISPGSGFGSVGEGNPGRDASAGVNQITEGTIQFDFSYQFSCANSSTGMCLGFDPNAANADNYLIGLAAHEMGHVLGLNDTGEDPCSAASTSVMGGSCGTNNNGDGQSKPAPTSNSPTSCDKQNVSSQTPASQGQTAGGSGGAQYGGGGQDIGGGGGYYTGASVPFLVDVENVTVTVGDNTYTTVTYQYSDGSSFQASFTGPNSGDDGSGDGDGGGDGGGGGGGGGGAGGGGGGGGNPDTCNYYWDPCWCW